MNVQNIEIENPYLSLKTRIILYSVVYVIKLCYFLSTSYFSLTIFLYLTNIVKVIFGADGVWGVNFEHSVAEAVPHALMNDYIYKFMFVHNIFSK